VPVELGREVLIILFLWTPQSRSLHSRQEGTMLKKIEVKAVKCMLKFLSFPFKHLNCSQQVNPQQVYRKNIIY